MKKNRLKKRIERALAVPAAVMIVLPLLLCGCSIPFISSAVSEAGHRLMKPVSDAKIEDMHLEFVNEAPGIAAVSGGSARVDFSNTSDGYVMVRHDGDGSRRVKAQVVGPEDTYSYTITPGLWEALPLSQGNGGYRVNVLENVEGSKYAQILTCGFSVSIKDEFEPFLRPNKYVNYSSAPNAVATAELITKDTDDSLEKIKIIYDYVIGTLTYDKEKAMTVSTGYVPDIDACLAAEKGICFDYASLMTGMLRAGGVPCKLVTGYAGDAFHAWITAWIDGQGWVDDIIYFDGDSWQRMDPTFASSGKGSRDVQQFIGDGSNYIAKYYY